MYIRRTDGPGTRTLACNLVVGAWLVSRAVVPPALDPAQQAELKAAVQSAPTAVGIEMANWNWKIVRQFAQDRFDRLLSRSNGNNYLHRLGFVVKRPKKQLLKANAKKQAAFAENYVTLRAEAEQIGAKIFFVDGARFGADVERRTK